jgi:hypothetical protein
MCFNRVGHFAGKMVFLPGQWQKLEKNLVKTGKNGKKWQKLSAF